MSRLRSSIHVIRIPAARQICTVVNFYYRLITVFAGRAVRVLALFIFPHFFGFFLFLFKIYFNFAILRYAIFSGCINFKNIYVQFFAELNILLV